MAKFKPFFWLAATLIAWLLCIRFLFPLPSFDMENQLADALIWSVYLVMLLLGVVSVLILSRVRSRSAYVCFSASVALYLLVRTFHFDFPIYAVMVDKFFDHHDDASLTWGLIFTGGKGLWGAVEIAIYAFVVPLILIASWGINFKNGLLGNEKTKPTA